MSRTAGPFPSQKGGFRHIDRPNHLKNNMNIRKKRAAVRWVCILQIHDLNAWEKPFSILRIRGRWSRAIMKRSGESNTIRRSEIPVRLCYSIFVGSIPTTRPVCRSHRSNTYILPKGGQWRRVGRRGGQGSLPGPVLIISVAIGREKTWTGIDGIGLYAL